MNVWQLYIRTSVQQSSGLLEYCQGIDVLLGIRETIPKGFSSIYDEPFLQANIWGYFVWQVGKSETSDLHGKHVLYWDILQASQARTSINQRDPYMNKYLSGLIKFS